MPLVVIDGVNSMGKSTLIEKIHNLYPQTVCLSFPTLATRGVAQTLYEFRNESLDNLFNYHQLFLEDFMVNNERLAALAADNTVLLDRYFFSNYAYFMEDFNKYLYRHDLNVEQVIPLERQLYQTLTSFYRELVQPDLVIYLSTNHAYQSGERHYYIIGLHDYFRDSPDRVVEVSGLNYDTFVETMYAILNRGLLVPTAQTKGL